MQVRWEYLTPPEFKKLVKEEQICILPLGILERHGEHLPYGTDGLSVHAIACRAAELEPCVVFPTYWFGQGHEASCFAGSVNFPPRLLYEMLEVLLDQIARNGFKKIVIFSGHGGNSHFLDYFAMTQLDREVTTRCIFCAAQANDSWLWPICGRRSTAMQVKKRPARSWPSRRRAL